MAFWISLREQLSTLWNQWSLAQRVGLSTAALACIAAVVGTVIWASQPVYVVIAGQLSADHAARIAGVLDTEKIGYKLNFSSTAVSVASGDVARARLALKDLISPAEATTAEDTSMFQFPTPASLADQRRGKLEKRISADIARIHGVRSATVSISQPDPSPFADTQSPVTAAVVVEPNVGEPMTSAKAHAIISHVANSVPGLTPEKIVLTDTSGRQFGQQEGVANDLAMQLEYRRQYESDMVRRVETFLNSAQGVRAKVHVTADIDFSRQKTFENKFDPDGKVKLTESVHSSKQDAGPAPPSGIPGMSTNLPPDANTGNSGVGKSTSEQIDVEYGNSLTSLEVENVPGKVRRLNVAAFVHVQQPPADPNAPQNGTPAALQQMELESLIRAAVGIDDERNDEIQVVLTPLIEDVTEGPVTGGFAWEQWQPMIQSISLGLAALLTFLIGMMLMRKMKPIVITQTVGPGIPLADARRLAAISEQARANPEIVANILSAWLNEKDQQEQNTPPTTPGPQTGGSRTTSTGGSTASPGSAAATSVAAPSVADTRRAA